MTEPDHRGKAPVPADKWENVIPRIKIQKQMTVLPDKDSRIALEEDKKWVRAEEEEEA